MLKHRMWPIIASIFLLSTSIFAAEAARLERVWVTEGIHGHRVILQLTSPSRYADLYIRRPPRVVIYLRDVTLNVERPVLIDSNLGVAAEQWMESPKIVKVTIDLSRPVPYQISREGDYLYVDLQTSRKFTEPGQRSVDIRPTGEPTVVRRAVSGGIASATPIVLASNPVQDGSRRIQEPGPLITLDVNEADIGNVLRLLSRQSKLNIIASKDVTGKVTLSLHRVTLKEALENILRANGYTYIVDGDVILVKPAEKWNLTERVTRVYRLRNVDAYNLKKTIEKITSDQAKITVFSRNFLAEEEGAQQGTTGENQRRSSTLIVTDLPENIRRIDTLVAELDRPVPMVMIEAKLIELSPKREGELGINWSKTLDAKLATFDETSRQNYSVRNPDVFRGGPWTFGTLTASQFGVVLDFLRRETHSKLVSNPRILAMDNEESIISVGTNFPVPQINRGVGGQGDVVTFQYRNVDISLRVRPHIDLEKDSITMYVNPIIEEVTGEVVIEKNRAPITSKRAVESVVTVRNGETLVIGGLIKESDKRITEKVWFLGDLPLLGNLFRHTKKQTVQTDLLIFITPRIVQEGS
jgi:type IV pilus assembly protein PilQ